MPTLIKFTKDCPSAQRKLGDTWEVPEESTANAYINLGFAERFTPPADPLADANRRLDESMAAFRTQFETQLAEITNSIGRGFAQANRGAGAGAGARFNPGFQAEIDPGESEDDKFLKRGGFRNISHFAKEVNRAGPGMGRAFGDDKNPLNRYARTLDRVNQARAVSSPDGMYETSDPDGGLLVPPDFTTQIWERVYMQESILPRTQGYTVSGNTMTIPANSETSRVDGSRWGGVLGYWEGEAQQLQGSRPKFRNINLRCKKLTVLTFATNELLTDSATALEQYLGRVAPEEIHFKILDALINGTGAGIPLGILNDPAFIQVAKDTGQATKTISYTNVMNVYNTMWAPSRARAIWVYNQEIEPQLWQMALPVGTGGVPVFLPPGSRGGVFGGAEETPFAMLYGRPALPLEQCPGLGSVGDLMLIDWSQYVSITKGSIQSAMSIHLKFDYDETCFRWIFRMDGQGSWSAPLTPYKTNLSKTYSFAVGIAAR